MRHHRYQVVAAGLVDPLVPQALEIHRALDEFLATLLKRFNYASLWRCGGDIRPTCELGPFLPGKIENRRKRHGGKFDRDQLDPVDLFSNGQCIEDGDRKSTRLNSSH